MGSPSIEVRGFSLELGGKRILRDVSLAAEPGDFISVIGPNGAGKTTLLKCLDRMLHGGTGTIAIKGKPLAAYRQRDLAKAISYVPQADGRSLPFTVMEFVLMGRYPHLSPFSSIGEIDRQAARHALDLVGARAFAERGLGTLSGGERQKVFIAAALAQDAEILLLDEPTTFLDPKHQADIRGILRRLNREQGLTILATTHDINSAAMTSERVLALKEGSVAFCGTPHEMMTAGTLERIYGKPFVFVAHPQTGQQVVVPEGATC